MNKIKTNRRKFRTQIVMHACSTNRAEVERGRTRGRSSRLPKPGFCEHDGVSLDAHLARASHYWSLSAHTWSPRKARFWSGNICWARVVFGCLGLVHRPRALHHLRPEWRQGHGRVVFWYCVYHEVGEHSSVFFFIPNELEEHSFIFFSACQFGSPVKRSFRNHEPCTVEGVKRTALRNVEYQLVIVTTQECSLCIFCHGNTLSALVRNEFESYSQDPVSLHARKIVLCLGAFFLERTILSRFCSKTNQMSAAWS